jgi:hypothetical protein
MRERLPVILRIACMVLAAVLVYQLSSVVLRVRPMARLTIPPLPSLPPSTNANEKASASIPGAADKKGTNATSMSVGKGTNSVSTNAIASAGTNSTTITNATAALKNLTNAPLETGGTNLALLTNRVQKAKTTGELALTVTGTNGAAKNSSQTNGAVPGVGGPNSASGIPPELAAKMKGRGMPPGMGMPMRGPGGKMQLNLPPEIQKRVDKISESEILGQVMHPLPMALLGLAGNAAILRTPSGQTGLVKEGDELGGVKLLRIAINRVLVEEDGQKKELTIFNGFGSESLLPK